ncbi:MAG TPA: hypothetical protein VK565_05520 [Gemmatimonadaceae bacterium]|nr:hypothetical protein [Gemmatimonadaceae bacterium]
MLDENLRQLIDPILNQHVARAGDCSCPMCHVVDRRPHDHRAFFRQHSRNGSRRSDLPGQALHKNCPNLRRFNAICQTINGFGFQTCSIAHVNPIEKRRQTARLTASSSGTT